MSASSGSMSRIGTSSSNARDGSSSVAPSFIPRQAISLADIYTDVLYLALDIQRGSRIGDPHRFREQVLAELDKAGGVALSADYSASDVADARYAVTSYIDEAVLNSSNPLREVWQIKPLQLESYDDNRAGEGFFKRLEALRQAPERNYRLLELYNLCLMLGFEGRYRLEERETLHNISAGVAQEIARLRGDKTAQFAPHAILRERRYAFHLRISVWVWPLLALLALWFAHRWLDEWLRVRAGALSQQATVLAGTPVHVKADMQSVLNAMLKGKSIAFESGRDILAPQGASFLDTLVPVLQGEPHARIALNGYTDGIGSLASNLALSQRRAQAVQRYLSGRGIASDRMEAHGFGAAQPVADNTSREGQAQNRRIEFKVLEDSAAP